MNTHTLYRNLYELIPKDNHEKARKLVRQIVFDATEKYRTIRATEQDNEMLTEIFSEAAKYFSISEAALKSKWRHREVVVARQAVMKCLHKEARMSATNIARVFKKNHATVLHAIKQVDNICEVDVIFREDMKTFFDICKTIIHKHEPFNSNTSANSIAITERRTPTDVLVHRLVD